MHCGKRWTGEYLTALREHHHCNRGGKPLSLQIGDVVIVHTDEKNRGKWPLSIVTELFEGRDGVVRAAKIRAGKTYLERTLQHLYPLELSCNKPRLAAEPAGLNSETRPFRPIRDAAVTADLRIQDAMQQADL